MSESEPSNNNNDNNKQIWYPGQGIDPGITNFAAFLCAYTFNPNGTCLIAINKDLTYAHNIMTAGTDDTTEEKYQKPTNYEYLHRKIVSFYKDLPPHVLKNLTCVCEQQWYSAEAKTGWSSTQMMLVNCALDIYLRQFTRMVFEVHPATWKARLGISKKRGSAAETRTQNKKRSLELARHLLGDQIFEQIIGNSDHIAEAFLIWFDHIKQRQANRKHRVTDERTGRVTEQPYPSTQVHFIVVDNTQFLKLMEPLIPKTAAAEEANKS
jgi:hypothetical protein